MCGGRTRELSGQQYRWLMGERSHRRPYRGRWDVTHVRAGCKALYNKKSKFEGFQGLRAKRGVKEGDVRESEQGEGSNSPVNSLIWTFWNTKDTVNHLAEGCYQRQWAKDKDPKGLLWLVLGCVA